MPAASLPRPARAARHRTGRSWSTSARSPPPSSSCACRRRPTNARLPKTHCAPPTTRWTSRSRRRCSGTFNLQPRTSSAATRKPTRASRRRLHALALDQARDTALTAELRRANAAAAEPLNDQLNLVRAQTALDQDDADDARRDLRAGARRRRSPGDGCRP